jgi:hypothetical protein
MLRAEADLGPITAGIDIVGKPHPDGGIRDDRRMVRDGNDERQGEQRDHGYLQQRT